MLQTYSVRAQFQFPRVFALGDIPRPVGFGGFGAAKDCAAQSSTLATCLSCCQGSHQSFKCKKICQETFSLGTPPPPDVQPPPPPGCTLNCGAGAGGVQCNYICPEGQQPPPYTTGGGSMVYPTDDGTLTGAPDTAPFDLVQTLKDNWLFVALGIGAVIYLKKK